MRRLSRSLIILGSVGMLALPAGCLCMGNMLKREPKPSPKKDSGPPPSKGKEQESPKDKGRKSEQEESGKPVLEARPFRLPRSGRPGTNHWPEETVRDGTGRRGLNVGRLHADSNPSLPTIST